MPWDEWAAGPWWLFAIVMPIVMLLVMLIGFTMFRQVFSTRPGRQWSPRPDDEDAALEILRRRFASGELTEQEFEEKRHLLQR
jgi:uncharacterized membrane protein